MPIPAPDAGGGQCKDVGPSAAADKNRLLAEEAAASADLLASHGRIEDSRRAIEKYSIAANL